LDKSHVFVTEMMTAGRNFIFYRASSSLDVLRPRYSALFDHQ
jgi:hypothetical protein